MALLGMNPILNIVKFGMEGDVQVRVNGQTPQEFRGSDVTRMLQSYQLNFNTLEKISFCEKIPGLKIIPLSPNDDVVPELCPLSPDYALNHNGAPFWGLQDILSRKFIGAFRHSELIACYPTM
jgi:hypothetical protein